MATPLESLFANLGTSLGGGIAGGLENLAQLRLQQIAQDRLDKQAQQQRLLQAGAYQQAGLPTWIAALPQGQQDFLFKAFAEGGGLQSLSQPQQEQALEMDQFTANQQAEQPTTQQPVSGLDFLNMLNQSKLQSQYPSGLQQAATTASAQQSQLQPKPAAAQVNQPNIRPSFGEAVSRGLTAKERAAQRKEEFERKKLIRKEEKPYLDQLRKETISNRETADTLDRQLKLIEEGELPPSALWNILDSLEEDLNPHYTAAGGALAGASVGGPFGALIGGTLGTLVKPLAQWGKASLRRNYKNTEEFEKLSNSFLRGAKTIFGARITDADLRAFMKMVPTLAQTDNGKKAIIRNMKIFNKAADIRYKIANDLIKKNGGEIPENLSMIVEEIASPQLDKLSKKFVTGENIS